MNAGGWINQQIGPYLIEEHIASGGMADVYVARDTTLGRRVCLKLMRTDLLDSQEFQRRFQREAQTVARLEHPHVVRVFDTGKTPTSQQPYIAMEYLVQGSLDKMAEWYRRQGLEVPTVRVLRIMRAVAATLAAVHREGVYHRDLKPANILLRESGQPVLADFGIAAVAEETRLTATDGHTPGSPLYMSPEQIKSLEVDGRSDIYSLGLIMYEMLAGHPFAVVPPQQLWQVQEAVDPPPLSQARPDLAPETVALVHRCLQKRPSDRFQSADELVKVLDRAIAVEKGEVASAPVPSEEKWLQRYWWVVVIMLLLLLLGWWGASALWQDRVPAASSAEAAVVDNRETAVATGTPLPTSTPNVIVVIASPTLIPQTNTPTATPTATATATETAVSPTPTLLPAATAFSPSTSAPDTPTSLFPIDCAHEAVQRWYEYANRYGADLGCPQSELIELPFEQVAFQQFAAGMMVWRGDSEYVYVIYDNGTFDQFSVTNTDDAYRPTEMLKGGFGWLWHRYAAVRNGLGDPVDVEANVRDFSMQLFDRGVIFSFRAANTNTYILFADGEEWVTP